MRGVGRKIGLAIALSGCVAMAGAQSDSGGVVIRMEGEPQAPQAGQPVGSVTGRVIAQDTQQPARFAQVTLQSVAYASGNAGGGFIGGGGGVNTRTDAEGNFLMENVTPGDYYVTASAPGYVPERMLLQAGVAAGADPAALLAQIPQVHVVADSVSSAVVTIERGGTISGRVQWEDGSPAAGVQLSAISPTATTTGGGGFGGFGGGGAVQLPAPLQWIQSPGGGASIATTDDRGAFRIAGLPSGDYLLRATIQAPAQTGGPGRGIRFASPIRVYSPGVFRRSQAKAVSVRTGDERSDVRMVINLRGLHTVSGHATSASGGQAVASGTVRLTDPNDSDLQLIGSIAPNGDFAVRYVPPGSYTLQISGASSQSGGYRGRGSNSSAGGSFQAFSEALTVSDSDVTGVPATLTPAAGSQ